MLVTSLSFKIKFSKSILIACSIIFCATTFAGDDFFLTLGVQPNITRILLGIASVLALISSVILIVIDWEEKIIKHKEAVHKLKKINESFRENWGGENNWTDEIRAELNEKYWKANHDFIEIPDNKFNKFKSKYLIKVNVSKIKSKYPGCPILFIRIILFIRDTIRFLRSINQS